MTIRLDGPLLLAGAGKMGGAILKGLVANGLPVEKLLVLDPHLSPEMATYLNDKKISHITAVSDVAQPPAVLLVAVKPQVMGDVFPTLAGLAGPTTIVISVAAGKTLSSFEAHVSDKTSVVRAMPNTPAAIGKGMTVCCGNGNVTSDQKDLCTALLQATGDVEWIANESDMDAVTAVSGSGPAYVFWFAECLAEAGRRAGLDPDLAAKLARATVAGAGGLLEQADETPTQLRTAVTSPGGTTAAALDVLMRSPEGLEALVVEAVGCSKQRSRELAS